VDIVGADADQQRVHLPRQSGDDVGLGRQDAEPAVLLHAGVGAEQALVDRRARARERDERDDAVTIARLGRLDGLRGARSQRAVAALLEPRHARAVGVALAGGDGVADRGHEEVADVDVGLDVLRAIGAVERELVLPRRDAGDAERAPGPASRRDLPAVERDPRPRRARRAAHGDPQHHVLGRRPLVHARRSRQPIVDAPVERRIIGSRC
jgi:hypothetical protein